MDFESDIQNCLGVLKSGGIILYPTDTIWGIGCDATNAKAVEKIFQLKKRPDEKAMIVLAAEERDVLKYVANVDLRVFDYLTENPKPVTVVYKGAIGIADNLVGKDGSIAIRICNDSFCKHLIKRFRKPIVSTSANISGQPPAKVFSEITDELKNAVDYTVKYRQDDQTIAAPSSVVKWNRDATVTVLRP
ncbi:MAG: L-threonylcarbamoyladenylate synthase [Chitinophagaceae bacterium]